MNKHLSVEDQHYLYVLLRTNKLVVQTYPYYSWDKSPPIFGLVVGEDAAFGLLSPIADITFTKKQLQGVLKKYGIEGFPSPFAGESKDQRRIDEFYDKRRDRKIRDQRDPSDHKYGVLSVLKAA